MRRENNLRLSLPPGKSVEQVLAFSDDRLGELAKKLDFSSSDVFRNALQELLTAPAVEQKSKKAQQGQSASAEKKKPVRQESVTDKVIVRAGLARFYFEYVPLDGETFTSRMEAADQAFRVAEIRWTQGLDQREIPHAAKEKIRGLYQRAYQVKAMGLVAEERQYGQSWSQARKIAGVILEDVRRGINLHEQNIGLLGVIEELENQVSGGEDLRALYEALYFGRPLTLDQVKMIALFMRQAKGIKGLPRENLLRSWINAPSASTWAAYCIAFELRECRDRKGKRTEAVSVFDFDTGGVDGYARRPHRDDDGASGGRDEK